METCDYIQMISKLSDRYGSELINMMEKYKKQNLCEITFDEAKEYYEKLQVLGLRPEGGQ